MEHDRRRRRDSDRAGSRDQEDLLRIEQARQDTARRERQSESPGARGLLHREDPSLQVARHVPLQDEPPAHALQAVAAAGDREGRERNSEGRCQPGSDRGDAEQDDAAEQNPNLAAEPDPGHQRRPDQDPDAEYGDQGRVARVAGIQRLLGVRHLGDVDHRREPEGQAGGDDHRLDPGHSAQRAEALAAGGEERRAAEPLLSLGRVAVELDADEEEGRDRERHPVQEEDTDRVDEQQGDSRDCGPERDAEVLDHRVEGRDRCQVAFLVGDRVRDAGEDRGTEQRLPGSGDHGEDRHRSQVVDDSDPDERCGSGQIGRDRALTARPAIDRSAEQRAQQHRRQESGEQDHRE